MALYITLAVTLFMIVMFIWHKVPFGVTTMTCCVVLAATGVVELNAAFSGFSNKIVFLIAPMLAMSAALSKTSLVANVSKSLNTLKGKQGIVLILIFYAVGIVFAQFIPTTGVIAIMIVFLATLGNTGEITANRLMLPLLGVMVAWKFRTPIGLGATTFATLNAMYEGIISDPQYQIAMLDPFKFAIIPGIMLTVYCIFGWKLMPKGNAEVDEAAFQKKDYTSTLPKYQENIIYAVFVIVMLVMILNTWTGSLMYLAPAAGVLVVADALGASGASDLIGNALLNILSGMSSPLLIYLVVAAVTVVMTTFLSNMATQAVLIPIVASVALAGGWDPRGLVLIIGTANYMAIAFPSGSGEAAVAFAAGEYNPAKVLKFTLPYLLIAIVGCALSAHLLYPLY